VRKATVASILAKAGEGIRLNQHMEGDGACKIGLEGIVSKRRFAGLAQVEEPGMRREAEED
jgi:hypothetical protein